ncbi:YybH family protein [Qaidamihabitans albus]|uniref:YybH family protein n=1 Tax=Qaidamihabitans albus TaxID=2795733 RepID=UPI0018F129E8|nr:nuclear transport factor 2 family protein [Qaidamihabitans albus]
MANDTDDVAALVEMFRADWVNRDAAILQSIWDPSYETVYCPAELDRPVLGKASIDQYSDRVVADISDVHVMAVSDVRIDVIDNVAWVFFSFHIEGLSGTSEPFTVNGRTTLMARRTDDGWKGIH